AVLGRLGGGAAAFGARACMGGGKRKHLVRIGSVATHPAGLRKFAKWKKRRYCMTCCQRGQLHRTVREQRVGNDQHRVGSFLHSGIERWPDIAIGCGGGKFVVLFPGRKRGLDDCERGRPLASARGG